MSATEGRNIVMLCSGVLCKDIFFKKNNGPRNKNGAFLYNTCGAKRLDRKAVLERYLPRGSGKILGALQVKTSCGNKGLCSLIYLYN